MKEVFQHKIPTTLEELKAINKIAKEQTDANYKRKAVGDYVD